MCVTIDHASFVYVILLQEGNFALCLQSLALDSTMDVCCIPNPLSLVAVCHIRDMMSLLVSHPNIRAKLRAGNIVVH